MRKLCRRANGLSAGRGSFASAFSAKFLTGAAAVLPRSGTGILIVINEHHRQDADATQSTLRWSKRDRVKTGIENKLAAGVAALVEQRAFRRPGGRPPSRITSAGCASAGPRTGRSRCRCSATPLGFPPRARRVGRPSRGSRLCPTSPDSRGKVRRTWDRAAK